MCKSTQARIDVTSLWSEPKEALISKLHNWHVFCRKYKRNCNGDEMVTDSQIAQTRGYDAAFLDLELLTLTNPNREDIFLRRELRVSENDADC
jgi:hypothetical protein